MNTRGLDFNFKGDITTLSIEGNGGLRHLRMHLGYLFTSAYQSADERNIRRIQKLLKQVRAEFVRRGAE